MITLCLGPAVTLSDDKSWTPLKRVVALMWCMVIDAAYIVPAIT